MYNTDKVEKGLLDVYKGLFSEYNVHGTLLEIGVFNGGFLKFADDSGRFHKIVGIDVDISCVPSDISDKVFLYTCSQNDITALKSLVQIHGGFDVVIDDGSHQIDDVKISFETLWKYTRSMYVIEDWDVMFEWKEDRWLPFMRDIMYERKTALGISEVRMGFRHTWGKNHGAYMAIMKKK